MIDVTNEQFIEKLADLVATRVAEKLGAEQPRELVDKFTLAERINLSVPTIERAVKHGKIPSVSAGRCRRFVVSEVIEAIKKAGRELTPPRDEQQKVCETD